MVDCQLLGQGVPFIAAGKGDQLVVVETLDDFQQIAYAIFRHPGRLGSG